MEDAQTTTETVNLHMIQSSWFQSTDSMDEYLMTGSISPSSPRTSKKLAKTLTVRRISSVRFAENKEEEAMTSIVPDINPMEVQQPLVPPLLYGAEYLEMAQNQPATPFRFSAALDDQKLQQFVEGFDVVHQHLVQRKSASSHLSGDEIYFDHSSHSAVNNKMCLVSSEGLDCGVHEWVIKILNSDIFLQEIGVIGVCELDDIAIHRDGLKATHQCGARAMFGNELNSDLFEFFVRGAELNECSFELRATIVRLLARVDDNTNVNTRF